MSDISDRVRESLGEVDVCYAEDTRHTGKLLARLGIRVPLRSLHAHNESSRLAEVLDRLVAGESVALVSDAGTPAVSDPGRRVVAAAHERGLTVRPVPGPSAVTAALSASGMGADRFLFAGFPPRRGGDRDRWLELVTGIDCTVVAFEAPGRLGRLLLDLAGAGLADREAVVCREMTKLHEELVRGSIARLATVYEGATVKGEVTLVISGSVTSGKGEGEAGFEGLDRAQIAAVVAELAGGGLSRRAISARLQERFGLTRNEAYRHSLTQDAGEQGD